MPLYIITTQLVNPEWKHSQYKCIDMQGMSETNRHAPDLYALPKNRHCTAHCS
jgi:hypothetical protein